MLNWIKNLFPAISQPSPEVSSAATKARGDALLVIGDWRGAEAAYREAIAANPVLAKAHGNLGFALVQMGRLDEAVASLNQALALDAGNADTHYMLGTLAAKTPHAFADAHAHFATALKLDPAFEAARLGLAELLIRERRLTEARQCVTEGIGRHPACFTFHRLMGEIHQGEGHFQLSMESYARNLEHEPEDANVLAGMAYSLFKLGQIDRAWAACEQAVAILRRAAEAAGPSDHMAWFNLGTLLTSLRRYDEALACFETSLASSPGSSETRIARGWLLLLKGEYAQGWEDYGGVARHAAGGQRDVGRPLWRKDADLEGKSILLIADQGIGDSLQLIRYVREIHALGAAAIHLDVQAPLKPLVELLPGVWRVLTEGEVIADFDFYCPLSRLPAAFGTTLDAMPDNSPYVQAPTASVLKWSERLGAPGALRVGVVWSGNPLFHNDQHRSMRLQEMLPLLEDGRYRFFLLQKDVRAMDAPLLQEFLVAAPHVTNLDAELLDFADTAGIVANLDLVITVDTSVAHLAGAMGKPVWILLAYAGDFRWLIDRADSPWYPSARLFRQPMIGDWASVVRELGRQLAALPPRTG